MTSYHLKYCIRFPRMYVNFYLNDVFTVQIVTVDKIVIYLFAASGNQSNIPYERTMSQGLVRRRSRNISYGGMCVFRTLACLQRTDSGACVRDTLRAISTVCSTARLIQTPCFLVFSVHSLLCYRLRWKRYAASVAERVFLCCRWQIDLVSFDVSITLSREIVLMFIVCSTCIVCRWKILNL